MGSEGLDITEESAYSKMKEMSKAQLSEKKDYGGTTVLPDTLSGNHSGRAALRRE
jgi:hypothetical protein